MATERALSVKQLFSGKEPSFKGVPIEELRANKQSILSQTLNWYASESDSKQSLVWLSKALPGKNFAYASNAGFLYRMIERGFPAELLQEDIKKVVAGLPMIGEVKTQLKPEKIEAPKKEKTIPTDCFGREIDPVVEEFMEKVDYMIDDVILGNSPKTIHLPAIRKPQAVVIYNRLQKLLDEYDGCSQKEEYAFGKRKENAIVGGLKRLMQNLQSVAPKQKKERKKKEVPVEKIVKVFEVGDFEDIKTSPATEIVGASMLVSFNSKYRRVSIIFAEEGKTLSVKGKSIINIDMEKSSCKTLRKPKEQLKALLDGHKSGISKRFNEIKSVAGKPIFRSSKEYCLVKVWK